MTAQRDGRRALVTGAGRGIGREIAVQLARSGMRVALTARSRDQLDDTIATIRSEGGTAVSLAVDIARTDGRAELLQMIADELGAVDVLINNAGTVAPLGHFTSLTEAGWESALRTNLIAPAELSAAVIPAMKDAGWGRIVNISSGVVANPSSMIGGNIYVSTKAALEAHTVNLATELDGTGITVNAYRPGMVDTAMQEWIRAQDPAQIGERLHDRFTQAHDKGLLISAADSAATLIRHLEERDTDNGSIWDSRPA
jgi:NAD(P)-dependent dehydrogenase (short-subunit alcohol dehydrogenase family)